MATYNFDTITAEQAAAFNPATDVLVFSTGSASDVGVVYGGGNRPNVTIFANGSAVILPATVYTVNNFQFQDDSQLYVGSAAGDTFASSLIGNAGYGGAGIDAFNFSGTDVFLQGNQGADTLEISGAGAGTVYGGMDADTILLSGTGSSIVNGNMGADDINVTGTGDNSIYGGQDGDNITIDAGASGDNFVSADRGADFVTVAGGGSNTVFGGDDADSFTVSGGGDNFIHGNAGADAISVTGGGDNSIYGGQGADVITLDGANGDNFVSGDLGNDTILVTSTGETTVFGGEGDDAITFSGGVTGAAAGFVIGNAGDDTITITGNGNYTVGGGQDDDSIDATGSDGNHVLNGDLGNDTIIGGAGNETIDGGAGVDVLTGGAGTNVFSFAGQANVATQGDIVTDFTVGTDNTVTFGAAAGNQVNYAEIDQNAAPTSFALAQAAADAQLNGVVRYVLVDGVNADFDGSGAQTQGSVLFADTNGDGTADAAIRLAGVTAGTFEFGDIV